MIDDDAGLSCLLALLSQVEREQDEIRAILASRLTIETDQRGRQTYAADGWYDAWNLSPNGSAQCRLAVLAAMADQSARPEGGLL